MEKADIENRFNYHAPDDEKRQRHEVVREELKTVALIVNDLCPEGREKSTAITKLEEAMYWANAAIARNPVHVVTGDK